MSAADRGIRWWLVAAWALALVVLAYFTQRNLELGTDLRLFLPDPTTPEERLLLEEVGEGAGSRVLIIALSGGAPEALADASRELRAALDGDSRFRFVANGETSLDALPESLLPYRYLLSDTLDRRAFDAAYLRDEIQARARDLASPAGAFLESWLPRDPTLELLKSSNVGSPHRSRTRSTTSGSIETASAHCYWRKRSHLRSTPSVSAQRSAQSAQRMPRSIQSAPTSSRSAAQVSSRC